MNSLSSSGSGPAGFRVLVLSGVWALVFSCVLVFAYPVAKHLVDSTPGESILVNLAGFYAAHPLTPGDPTRSDKVFESPRCVVAVVTNKGPLIGRHIHTSADEIVYVLEGSGEMYINGQWIPVKGGDLHVCPRGVSHATRVVGDKEMKVISIFTPPQTGGNDRIMIDE